jgi:hypothetical protein
MELGATDPLLEDCATTAFLAEEVRQRHAMPVDLLVVVDNSGSMSQEQDNLARNLPRLIQDLLSPPVDPETGDLVRHPVLDLHVGVISTDMGAGGHAWEPCTEPVHGDDGVLRSTPDASTSRCGGPFPRFLSYESEWPREAEVDQLAHDFGCIANLGTDGCGFEQPLGSLMRAIEQTRHGGPNSGFLREDSILAVLILTDEDDCTVIDGPEGAYLFDPGFAGPGGGTNLVCVMNPDRLEPLENVVGWLRELRPVPEYLVLGFIVGVPPGSECEGYGHEIGSCHRHPEMITTTESLGGCDSITGETYPAWRLVALAQMLGPQAYVQSICSDDYWPALSSLHDRLVVRIDNLLFHRNLPVEKDPDDRCRCLTQCELVEMLDSDRPCPEGKPCVRSTGPRAGCRIDWKDGTFHSLCTIPQIGTRISDCEASCWDVDVVHTPDESAGEGWYWFGGSWTLEGGLPYHGREPHIRYSIDGMPELGSELMIRCETCLGEPTLTPVTGGEIGTLCFPETCPPLLDEDTGETIPGECGWESNETYIAEAEECLGGACLAFRVETGLWEPYCSRRCGRSGGRACPDGYECVAAYVDERLSPGCYCVYEGQLNLAPGSLDVEKIWACQ